MGWKDQLQKPLRRWKLNFLLRGEEPTAGQVGAAVVEIIARARRDEKNGVQRDRWLFGFESEFEEISDEISRLRDRGETEAYRELYGRLYAFTADTMEDSYMPLYLYILYRYANAELETGDPGKALALFQKLYDGTERLIGVQNPYGIHCLERLAMAAVMCGQSDRAADALDKMYRIAKEEFGPDSAMMRAVLHYTVRLRKEYSGGDCIRTGFGIQ